jgi:hypothetical protein
MRAIVMLPFAVEAARTLGRPRGANVAAAFVENAGVVFVVLGALSLDI